MNGERVVKSDSKMNPSATKMPGRPNMVLGANYGPDTDPSRWVVIYPPYIDATRTEKQVMHRIIYHQYLFTLVARKRGRRKLN